MSPRVLQLLLVALVAVVAVLATLLITGGDDGGSEDVSMEVDDDFAKFSGEDVQEHFEALTGAELEASGAGPTLETLSLPSGPVGDSLRNRYGSFSVFVTGNEETLDRITNSASQGEENVYDNVVVTIASASSDVGDAGQAQRLQRIFETLGTPPEEVELPPEETPCEEVGIAPEGGGEKEGTCRFEQFTLTIANADNDLEVEDKTLSDLRLATGDLIVEPEVFGPPDRFRARGSYIATQVDIENTGNQPITSLDASLVVNGKRYSPDDSSASFALEPEESPFPIQPGGSGTAVALFDIPKPAARAVVAKGTLEVLANEEQTSVEFATGLGRLRLEGAPRIEGRPAPRGPRRGGGPRA